MSYWCVYYIERESYLNVRSKVALENSVTSLFMVKGYLRLYCDFVLETDSGIHLEMVLFFFFPPFPYTFPCEPL